MTNAFKKGMGDAPKRHQVLIREEIKSFRYYEPRTDSTPGVMVR